MSSSSPSMSAVHESRASTSSICATDNKAHILQRKQSVLDDVWGIETGDFQNLEITEKAIDFPKQSKSVKDNIWSIETGDLKEKDLVAAITPNSPPKLERKQTVKDEVWGIETGDLNDLEQSVSKTEIDMPKRAQSVRNQAWGIETGDLKDLKEKTKSRPVLVRKQTVRDEVWGIETGDLNDLEQSVSKRGIDMPKRSTSVRNQTWGIETGDFNKIVDKAPTKPILRRKSTVMDDVWGIETGDFNMPERPCSSSSSKPIVLQDILNVKPDLKKEASTKSAADLFAALEEKRRELREMRGSNASTCETQNVI